MADETRKASVFISYSRDDLAFAEQLDAALKLAKFDTRIDSTIPGGDEWETRLAAFIREADTVVFVLSPSSTSSRWCQWEVERAVESGKRILPILCRPLDGSNPPHALAALNYIYFYAEPTSPGSGWGTGIAELASALDTDLAWLREHTRYLQRATEWEAGKRAANRLLSGADIDAAKAWAASRPKAAPEPTELQRDFIKASEAEETRQKSAEAQRLKEMADAQAERGKALAEREAAQKREAEAQRGEVEAQKRFTRAALVGLAAALSLAAAATWQYLEARAQRDAADKAKIEAQANADRAEANLREAKIAQQAADEARKLALDEKRRAEDALAETERGLLRAQTAELRAMIERLDLLKSSDESKGKTDELDGIDRERTLLAKRLDDVSHRYAEKVAAAMGFRGDLDFLMKREGSIGGVKINSETAEIDPFTSLNFSDPATIKARYEYLLTPDEMTAVLSLIGKRGDDLKLAYEQHRTLIDRIVINPTDVAQLVPEAVRPFWTRLLNQYPVLAEDSTPGSVHTALLSLATNVGINPKRWSALSSAISDKEWLRVADLVASYPVAAALPEQIRRTLTRRRVAEADLIRNELNGPGAASGLPSEPAK